MGNRNLDEPLSEADARKVIREIIEDGEVSFWHHARERMAQQGLSQADCLNILRGGSPGPAELQGGRWRHQVHTVTQCAVVQFESATRLSVVTVWRK